MKRLFLLAVLATFVGASAFALSSNKPQDNRRFHTGAGLGAGYETYISGLNIWNFRVSDLMGPSSIFPFDRGLRFSLPSF